MNIKQGSIINLIAKRRGCLILSILREVKKSLPSNFEASLDPEDLYWVSGNISGVGDRFPNTFLVLMEHGYYATLLSAVNVFNHHRLLDPGRKLQNGRLSREWLEQSWRALIHLVPLSITAPQPIRTLLGNIGSR